MDGCAVTATAASLSVGFGATSAIHSSLMKTIGIKIKFTMWQNPIEFTCIAETTDSVSRKKDSVSKLLSLGSDMSLGRGDERERELPLLVTADGTLGSRRRGR